MRYRVAKQRRGRWVGWVCIIYHDDGRRQRIALKTPDKFLAGAEAAKLVADLEACRPKQRLTVGQIVEMYLEQSEAIWKENDSFHWKGIRGGLASLSPDDVSEKLLKRLAAEASVSVGTIRKRYTVVRAALNWASRKGLLPGKAPHIWLPPAPPPRDRRLSREEYEKLEEECWGSPHLVAFVRIARYTAARSGAILGLRWECVDLHARRINLGGSGRQKRRAVVPIHPELAWTLALVREAAETDHVIEWAGKPVKSIKNAFRRAVTEAGLGKEVTPHVLRHTAASWMAEAGVPMSEIAAVLGHSDSRVTEKHYAKYSPTYLQRAVRALG